MPEPTEEERRRALVLMLLLGGMGQTVNGQLGPRGAVQTNALLDPPSELPEILRPR